MRVLDLDNDGIVSGRSGRAAWVPWQGLQGCRVVSLCPPSLLCAMSFTALLVPPAHDPAPSIPHFLP